MTTKQYEDSSHVVMSIELLLCEILSRLPVKPLMRFKCVCKQWQSLIHKDRNFTNLHFKRSKTCIGNISLFIGWPVHKVFSSAKLLPSVGGVAAVQREVPIPGASDAHVFGAVNGLLSLVELSTYDVCVFNPSTGQSTPWIKSMMKQQHENLREEIQVIDEDGHHVTREVLYVNDRMNYFGYDPATREHKVVCIWKKMIFKKQGRFLRAENICEVMTIDGRQHNNNNLSWRRIDGELSIPPTISPFDFNSSVYANGSIYWLRTLREPLIVEFNVGSEKFRVIPIPNYIIKEIHYPYKSKLIQIDGRLAVLAKTTNMHLKVVEGLPDDYIINNNQQMKMCILHDKDIITCTVTSTSSAAGSSTVSNSVGDFYWIQETFMMPHSDWGQLQFDSIQAVPGTDLLIIRSEEGETGSRFYFFDLRNKSFSEESFFIAERMTSSFRPDLFEYSVYNESILPVI